MTAATDRVRDFLNARVDMTGIDPEQIAVVFVGGERRELTASDLWDLVGDSVQLEDQRGDGE